MSGEDALFVGIPDVTVERSRSVLESRNATHQANVAIALPQATPITVTVPMPIEFREGYLEIREIATKQVVTVIEILSPTNKRFGKRRVAYEEKRREVLGSRTHLVEIDLLRSGKPMPIQGSSV